MTERMADENPDERPCPHCGALMRFTGLPDVAGPVYVRFFRCKNCGVVKVNVKRESPVGWG